MAWTESSKGNVRSGDYHYATESLTVPDPGAAAETTVNSTALGTDISGSKIMVGLEVTAVNDAGAVADGALNIRVQASLDNTNWLTADTMSLDVDNTGTNSAYGDADLSAWYAPYWRFQVFSDGTDIDAAPTVSVTFAAMDLPKRVHPE